MFENLLDELAERGLTWTFDESAGGLSSYGWEKSKETCRWIQETAIQIIDGSDPRKPNSYPKADPKALLLISHACEILCVFTDGSLAQDVAIIAYKNAESSGHIELGVEIVAKRIITNGRYIDCLEYFHGKYLEGTYDESFLPDIAQAVDVLFKWHEEISGDHFDWPNEAVKNSSLRKNILQLNKMTRGAFMQIEMGIRLMNSGQIMQFVQEMAPRTAIIIDWLDQQKDISGADDAINFTQSRSTMAYLGLMLRNLGGPQQPIESLLRQASLACMDDEAELPNHPIVVMSTLFAHVMRLRILSGENIDDERWEHAVSMARRVVSRCPENRWAEIYAEIIDNLIEHGRILDLEQYAQILARTI